MKRRFLSILLALCMIISILPMSALAADYEGHWSSEYIVKAKDRGWMNGYEDGTFRPNKSITRAEFYVMLWRALGAPRRRAAARSRTLRMTSGTEKR